MKNICAPWKPMSQGNRLVDGRTRDRKCAHAGSTLLEVLIGIVIFAFGIMALAQLQSNLSKGSADSNARSVAINIAEQTVEAARSFSQVTASSTVAAFNNIITGTSTESRGGIDYSVARVVTNYYYQEPATVNGNGTFTTTRPNGVANPDMKRLDVTVTWSAGQQFQIDETQQSSNLGSGSITVSDVISSIPATSGGKVLLNATTSNLYSPPVDYLPGQNPDIISIRLGDNRFKESTTPLPRIFNANERVETKFDVVTYSQSDSGATFLRREEFLAVACQCILQLPSTDTEGGRRPTLWNGNDYTEGEFVFKPYGESVRDNATNFQSEYCSLCCRDHHDGGTGLEDDANDPGRGKFSPFKGSSEYYTTAESTALAGDHKHYGLNGVGLADSDGDTYFEACRLVRKDGFFRVAQDLRQEGLNSFPASYLDEASEVAEYSDYVTAAVAIFTAAAGNNYELNPPALTHPHNMSPEVVFPASKTTNRTSMNSTKPTQQLRARGVYVDYISDELRTIVTCMGQDGATGSACGVTGANSVLEVIPFYDVQLTWLARWNESPINTPITVSNDEAIQTNNTHDRGVASLVSYGNSTITTKVNKGNLGLTGSDPIDNTYAANLEQYNLYALGVSTTTPPASSGFIVNGSITSNVAGVKASDVEIAAINGAQCDRTLTGFACIVPASATNPRLTVTNYFKRNADLSACSVILNVQGTDHSGSDVTRNWTRFNLPQTGHIYNADIYIKQGTNCP